VNQPRNRSTIIYVLLFAAIIFLVVYNFQSNASAQQTLSINQVAEDVQQGKISRINVEESSIRLVYKEDKEGIERVSHIESTSTLVEQLKELGVTTDQLSPAKIAVEVKPPSPWLGIATALGYVLPFLILGGVFWFVFRQAQGSNNAAMSFGKSRARMFTGDQPTVTFEDVAGVDESKVELEEVVEFLKEPEKFISLGARIPKGVLLVGPPGTGKTLLAKAVSGEAGVPFFSISGSEFVEMFVGVGASRVRDLFDQAKRHSPCIVFVDEIDAVGRQRGAGLGGSHDEREQTLNQILTEMDGFDTNVNIIILAATNRPDILDPALLRPGRFDRRVVLDLPDVVGRAAILKVHSKNKPMSASVNMDTLAKETAGFSGADLANLLNEAAILAARQGQKTIEMKDLEESIDKVSMGPERRSKRMSPKDKELTAYHEAGHALVAKLLPNADPPHKISIIARGIAGGYTRMLPEDRAYWSKSRLTDGIAVSLAGLCTEKLIYNEVSSGSSSDLRQATGLARRMVTDLGMSDILGPRTYGDKQELVFLGREISETKDYSERTALEIDREINRIITEASTTATRILTENKELLVKLTEALISRETLDLDELEALFRGETLPPKLVETKPPETKQPEAKAPQPTPGVTLKPQPATGSGGMQ
jgi:cell division protease FtsH